MAVSSERVEFPSRRGNRLVGDLHRAGSELGPVLLLCHGMESTRGGTKQTAIVERFVPLGFSVLRFDFSFVGDSEGDFEDMTISGEVEDALGALDFLDGLRPGPVTIVGSSLGGAVSLLAASRASDRVAAVATIAAVTDTALFAAGMSDEEIARWRETGKRAWGTSYLRSGFLDDAERLDIPVAVAGLDKPMLVMHGDSDPVVPPAHGDLLARVAGDRARLVSFPGVGHRFEEPGALDGLLDALEAFVVPLFREETARV